jgi:hypothetical protein
MESPTDVFVKRANSIHGDKYDYSKAVYSLANTKLCIICKEHGEFYQSPAKHVLAKHGCPKCGIKKCSKAITVPFEEFVRRARNKHGNKYTYIDESYVGYRSKVKVICPNHGEFQIDAVSHCITLTGCKKCGTDEFIKKKTITSDEFIKRGKEIHGDKYDYSKTVYINGRHDVTIICKIHGEFQQKGCNHFTSGCRRCADDLHASKSRKTTEEFIESARKIWGDTYNYSQTEYTNSNSKVTIICHTHGEFIKIAKDHLIGGGCQKCKPPKHSKLSIQWLKYRMIADGIDIQYSENGGEHRIANSLYHADGYNEETNTIYEFLGSYWHGDPSMYSPEKVNKHNNITFGELYQNTLKKREHCLQNGYNVIECWESEWVKGVKAVKKLQKKFRLYRKV